MTLCNALAFALGFPVGHPFTAAPAVGAEERNFLSRQFRKDRFEHGTEVILLQHFAAHGGASEDQSIIGCNASLIEVHAHALIDIGTGAFGALGHCVRHGGGIAGSGPVYNCNFHEFVSSILLLGAGLRFSAVAC